VDDRDDAHQALIKAVSRDKHEQIRTRKNANAKAAAKAASHGLVGGGSCAGVASSDGLGGVLGPASSYGLAGVAGVVAPRRSGS
jgi:hypothetical protein